MNYFFMPRLKGLKSKITLANFPCVDDGLQQFAEQMVYVTWSENFTWQVRTIGIILPGQIKTFFESDLPQDLPSTSTPFLFLYPDKVSPTLDHLFASDLMETTPSWRANIGISSETTSTSFQGEYPGNLIQVKKGTLFSFGPMVLAQTGLTTKFLLINLRAKPGNEPCRIKFGLLGQEKILKEAIVFQNSCSLVDLSGLCFDESELIYACSDEITGIPLYFSHDHEFKKLSLEHSHPPTELLVFGNRAIFQNKIKLRWLGKKI